MVIHQFNKLIRNKWVWGVFAVVVSAAFCFDHLLTDSDRGRNGEGKAGSLGKETVTETEFNAVTEGIRGFGQGRDWKRPASEVNRIAWETIAAIRFAQDNGVEATDAEVREMIIGNSEFSVNGVFSYEKYKMILKSIGQTPERFEEYLKRRITFKRVSQDVLESAAWVSPMEIDRAVADRTDVYTVKVAKFTQTKEEADGVKLDDAGLLKWYEANTNSLALPERIKIRYVKYFVNDEKVLAKMSVSDEEMHDFFDANSERWTTTDTNGVEQVKNFDEVKGEVEKELRKIAALQYFETNLTTRAYGFTAAEGKSRLDEIAAEDGQKVQVSDWFTTDGSFVEGFMKRPGGIFPGVSGMVEAAAQLDPENDDLRYGVALGNDSAWLIERAEVSPAHIPAFDEAKDIIRPRALEDAKSDAFKAKVEAVAKKGFAEVEKVEGISSNIVFCVNQMNPGQFADQWFVADAAMKLAKGEVSEFTRTGKDTALLVLCVDRVAGDPTDVALLNGQVREQLAMIPRRQLPEEWLKWNLERLGYKPETGFGVDVEKIDDEEI